MAYDTRASGSCELGAVICEVWNLVETAEM